MNLRIAVVGSGAIGSYYGIKLACSGGDSLSDARRSERDSLRRFVHSGLG